MPTTRSASTVSGATDLAEALGVAATTIGLFVVAIGTSLPELVTSIIAAARKEADLALGNVIGSNIFNMLCILGLTSIAHPIAVAPQALRLDYWVVMVISLLVLLVLTMVGTLFLATSNTETQISGHDMRATQALFNAEAGYAEALARMSDQTDSTNYIGQATNNIAELTAILRAVELATELGRPLRLYTDSQYSIGVLAKGWKAKANNEMVQSIKKKMKKFKNLKIVKIKGHAGDEGHRHEHGPVVVQEFARGVSAQGRASSARGPASRSPRRCTPSWYASGGSARRWSA